MKGSNRLMLNEATMIEAVQFWLNAQMNEAPIVTHVTMGGDRYSQEFEVMTDERKPVDRLTA